VLDAFPQSVNNICLKRHLLVAKVDMMERAYQLKNAYFQVNSPSGPRVNMKQMETDNGLPLSEAAAAVYLATAASAANEANLTTNLFRKLLAKIKCLQQQPAAKRPVRLPTAVASRHPSTCWGCGSGGHFLRSCLHGERKRLNLNGPW